jgi:hypothetical protein
MFPRFIGNEIVTVSTEGRKHRREVAASCQHVLLGWRIGHGVAAVFEGEHQGQGSVGHGL